MKFSEMDRTERNTVWQAAIYKLEPKGDVIRTIEDSFKEFNDADSKIIDLNTSHRYQLRCVKESSL